MRWAIFAALLIGFCSTPALAGGQRAYVVTGQRIINGHRVIIVEDVTPRPIRTRTLRGINKPPYNPVYQMGRGGFATLPSYSRTTRSSRTGGRTAWRSPPANPVMIYNPYVEQK